MTTLPIPLSFKQSAIPFLGSSPQSELVGRRAAAALFGAPLDLTESFRSGAHSGPAAVREFSDSLETYSPALDRDLQDLVVADLGDLDLAGKRMEEALRAIERAAVAAATAAGLVVMLGGEHTASLGGFRGIRRVYPDAVLLQVDAHLDFREAYLGEPLTHASWLFHVGAEFGHHNLLQVGVRSGDRAEWSAARQRTAWTSSELAIPPSLREEIGRRPVYLSLDIDVLDPAHAPGTGCPEPGGVSFRELAAFLYTLGDLRVVALDVMEVSSVVDPSGITAVAAAKLVREAVLLFGRPATA